eukprot:1181942-Prorocentrum_minimum.AAC.2
MIVVTYEMIGVTRRVMMMCGARVMMIVRRVARPGVDCRPANGSLSAGNIRRVLDGIFEIPCAELYNSVDSRRLSTVELKSKAFLADDSGACARSKPRSRLLASHVAVCA